MRPGQDSEADYRARLLSAARALSRLEKQVEQLQRERTEPIAVIGMGCRFPGGADDPQGLWRVLSEGRDTVTDRRQGSPAAGAAWGAYLSQVDGFDAAFFGISPHEAARLDPQHRLLLEVGWEALEDAGVVPEQLAGTDTGVMFGMSTNDYLLLSQEAGVRDGHTGTGTAHSFGPGRLSYLLGLRGPNMAVDTACSSSLVAVHLAVRSLRTGESSLALAGGVNLILSDATTETMADLQALSPDGRCRTFDAQANGFVRGEGCGVVVLKRLSDALADGDRVLALVRGSAVNSDGHSAGLTAPSPAAQRQVLRRALADARVDAEQIGYVETHGTGTALGDPIEVEALTDVLGTPRTDGSRCVLGAVKTHLGHLEAAAGMAGLIKAVLALRHGTIPANLHFGTLNPRIALTGTPFQIPRSAVPWEAGQGPRLAGVSAFGMSGTNAHVVLAEADAATDTPAEPGGGPVLLPLSARGPQALRELARAYAGAVEQAGDPRDIAYSAGVRRQHHDHRLAVVGASPAELAGALRAASPRQRPAPGPTRPEVTFVFSGQGSTWPGMGRELLAAEPVFAAALHECDTHLARHAPFSLLSELAEPARLHLTEVAQPVLFGVQVALAALLSSWGVTPDAVIGHSVGEVAAAYVAGALDLPEAARLVVLRGRAMAAADGAGAMALVALDAASASAVLSAMDTGVVVAAVNDPRSVVLSGAAAELAQVAERLRQEGVRCRPLRVEYAFHSPRMASQAKQLAQDLGIVRTAPTACPLYSTVTGERLAGEELTAAYWAANVSQPVRFADAAAAAYADGQRIFVELSPHPVLSGHIQDGLPATTAVPTLRQDKPERRDLLNTLGALYTAGQPVDFARLYPQRRPVVSLPAYPWQRRRHWLDAPPAPRLAPAAGPLLGTPLDDTGTAAVHARWSTAGEALGRDTVPAAAPEAALKVRATGRAEAVHPLSWPGELRALPEADREAAALAAVRADVAAVLGLASASDVPPDQPLMSLGLDSLMTVQLRHELAARTGWSLPATLAFDHPTPAALSRHLLDLLATGGVDTAREAADTDGADGMGRTDNAMKDGTR